MKQTAVEWLQEISKRRELDMFDFIEAKQMEREQITSAYQSDRHPCSDEDAEQYYKETYKSE